LLQWLSGRAADQTDPEANLAAPLMCNTTSLFEVVCVAINTTFMI